MTILNVALPTLAADIQASTSELQWIVDAYVLVFAGLLLPAGALGDRYGRRLLILAGLVLFGAASAVATFTTDPAQLIAIRAVMGVGAAVLTPVTMAVLPVLFPAEADRRKAIAAVTAATGVGIPLGPLVGGYLLDHFWWGSVFLVNVPIAAVALVAVAVLIPESRDPSARPTDLPGAVLSTLGLVVLVYGIIEGPDDGAGPVPQPALPVRLHRRDGRRLRAVRTALRAAAVLAGGTRQRRVRHRAATAADDGRPDRRRTGQPASRGDAGQQGPGRDRPSRHRGRARLGRDHRHRHRLRGGGRLAGGDRLRLRPGPDRGDGRRPQRPAAGPGRRRYRPVPDPAPTRRRTGHRDPGQCPGRHLPVPPSAGTPQAARDSIAGAVAVAARLGDPTLLAAGRRAYLDAMSAVLLVCAAVAVAGAALSAVFMPGQAPQQPAEEESAHEVARPA